MKMVDNVIYADFPERKNGESVPVIARSSQVVFDMRSMITANLRRSKFHVIMKHLDEFEAKKVRELRTKDDIYKMLLVVMREELGKHGYTLNYDTLNALAYIAATVTGRLEEIEKYTFRAPRFSEIQDSVKNPSEKEILSYVFLDTEREASDDAIHKSAAKLLYQTISENIEKLNDRSQEDYEYMYLHLGMIFPLLIDSVRVYMGVYRHLPDSGIDHSANS